MVAGLAPPSPTATAAAKEFEGRIRVLAVASGPPSAMTLVGLIALRIRRTQTRRHHHGIAWVGRADRDGDGRRSGDAAIVAHAVGLDGAICPLRPIPEGVRPEAFAVFAGVLPEDRYKLVRAFQKSGHIVGMCGERQ